VAQVAFSAAAAEDLERLILTHSLPADTRERVKRTLRPLERFPLMGAELGGRWQDLRFVLGPWRWMVIIYGYVEDEDRVVVVTIQDGRSSTASTGSR
jgi:plasmid stabilization system protein ParE